MSWPLRIALAVAACLALLASAAPAGARVQVGIGENNPSVFDSATFRQLGIKRARIILPWDVALRGPEAEVLDSWLAGARAAGVEPLVHFGAAGGNCPKKPCVLPTVRAYTNAFKRFRARWPQVRSVGVWNEANHRAQPTFKNPKRAAQYFNVVRRLCRGCRVVAADVLDDPNMVRWIKTFKRYAKRPRLWGLHNYRDANPRKGQLLGGTKRLLKITRGPVWLTESGGIAKFVLPNNHTSFPFSEARQNLAVKRLFTLARKNRKRIARIYLWGWRAPTPDHRFDSALLRLDETPRPAFFTLQRLLRTPLFRP